jgi:hypothetical protein
VSGGQRGACVPTGHRHGRSLPDTSSLADRNSLHPFQIGLKRRNRKIACVPLAPFEFSHFLLFLFLQRLSRGSADTLASPMELTPAQEVEDAAALASAHEDAEGLVQ